MIGWRNFKVRGKVLSLAFFIFYSRCLLASSTAKSLLHQAQSDKYDFAFCIYFHHERRERTSNGIIHLHIIQFKYYLFTLTLFPFSFLLVDLVLKRETKSVYVCVTLYGYCYIDTFRLTWKNDGFFFYFCLASFVTRFQSLTYKTDSMTM